ncbi:holin [Alkalihalobacillus sp. FSL R5-0424]
MELVLILATIIAPIVLALIEVFKKALNIKVTLLPLFALVIGVLVGAAAYPFSELELVLRLWAGALAGLSATGLFELGKKREGQTKEGN